MEDAKTLPELRRMIRTAKSIITQAKNQAAVWRMLAVNHPDLTLQQLQGMRLGLISSLKTAVTTCRNQAAACEVMAVNSSSSAKAASLKEAAEFFRDWARDHSELLLKVEEDAFRNGDADDKENAAK
jgi:hypothetical protein